nr:aminotransferase class V-fold PLP-dependent enzyme [Desulfobacula sp.]
MRPSGKTGPPDLVLLAPASSHYSIAKAAGIMGMGEKKVLPLATDSHGRVRVSKLEASFQAASGQGRRIVALTANACATGTGLYDPVGEIGDFCNEKGIWFHVDGAHGGAALFSGTRKNFWTESKRPIP